MQSIGYPHLSKSFSSVDLLLFIFSSRGSSNICPVLYASIYVSKGSFTDSNKVLCKPYFMVGRKGFHLTPSTHSMIFVAGNKDFCCQQQFMFPCTQQDTRQRYAYLQVLRLIPEVATSFFHTNKCNLLEMDSSKKQKVILMAIIRLLT